MVSNQINHYINPIIHGRLSVLKSLRILVHIVLFLLAAFVFFFGLGIGLQLNPTYGTLLWIAAALIAAGNVWWMLKAERR